MLLFVNLKFHYNTEKFGFANILVLFGGFNWFSKQFLLHFQTIGNPHCLLKPVSFWCVQYRRWGTQSRREFRELETMNICLSYFQYLAHSTFIKLEPIILRQTFEVIKFKKHVCLIISNWLKRLVSFIFWIYAIIRIFCLNSEFILTQAK